MKRVFIIHGWDGYPEENWFPWLRQRLEEYGFEVQVPQLPDAENPRIEKWVPAVAKTVVRPDKQISSAIAWDVRPLSDTSKHYPHI